MSEKIEKTLKKEDTRIEDKVSSPRLPLMDKLVRLVFSPKKPFVEKFSFEENIPINHKVKLMVLRELGNDYSGDIEEIIDKLPRFLLDYLQDWDELEINVPSNPDLKKTILKNIIKSLEKIIVDLTEEKLIILEDLQKKIEELVDSSYFFRATEYSVLVNNILQGDKGDQRWKSQFETNTSNGSLNFHLRSKVEHHLFGFPNDEEYEKEKRPIYGFFTPDENGILNKEGKHPPSNLTSGYGKIHCKVKKEVALSRATFAFQDSLSNYYDCFSTPVAKPSLLSLEELYYSKYSMSYFKKFKKFISSSKISVPSLYELSSRYTEVQYHDGLSITDIESIHVSTGNGSSEEEIDNLRKVVEKYNKDHPDKTIEFIVY